MIFLWEKVHAIWGWLKKGQASQWTQSDASVRPHRAKQAVRHGEGSWVILWLGL